MASKKFLLFLAAAVAPSQAAIAAWWNGIAPQIILQNQTTGNIRHSSCNVFGTPSYSYTDGSELPLDLKPMNGTPLAGVGYYNDVTTIASIYYIEAGGALANALVECNMATGLFRSNGNRIISNDVTVNNKSGLAAVLLGATGGYRVYFNDADMQINEIGYTTSSGWEFRGIISKDPQSWGALGAAFTGKENITVASARDARSIEVVRYHSDANWRISTLPYTLEGNITTQATNASQIAINETAPVNFTLTAWTGQPKGLGVSIDSEYTRHVWYIGNDSALYGVRNKNFYWSQVTNQSDAFWPLADEPHAELGVATQFSKSMVRIYYFVKGQLAEVKYENGTWKSWSHLGPPKPVVQKPANSTDVPDPSAGASSSGLSTGAKAGVGVGVALGVIALGVLVATFFLMRKRKNDAAAELQANPPAEPPQPSPVPPYGSPAPPSDPAGYDHYGAWEKKNLPQPPYEPVQLDATGKPTELDAPRPMYELPDQTYSHELVGDGTGHVKPPTPPTQPGHQTNQ